MGISIKKIRKKYIHFCGYSPKCKLFFVRLFFMLYNLHKGNIKNNKYIDQIVYVESKRFLFTFAYQVYFCEENAYKMRRK
jgi:hypothetical protein